MQKSILTAEGKRPSHHGELNLHASGVQADRGMIPRRMMAGFAHIGTSAHSGPILRNSNPEREGTGDLGHLT